MRQTIFPARRIFFAGDRVTFTLNGIGEKRRGKAIVRTNLGRAQIRRGELIGETESGVPAPGLDWNDIELVRDGDRASVTLGLPEVGVFEAKCCFIPEDGSPIVWAEGNNFFLKVQSPESVGGNLIYAAFVRQFGKDMEKAVSGGAAAEEKTLEKRGCTVIPPGGTFRSVIARLDHIFENMHCRILQLLPVHPIPTQYGKMGRYGSPFAALDYFNVDSALADFDPAATPMEQFMELIDAVHARRGRIMMDIPVNHTGWASKLQAEHPDYFVRESDGTFVSPGAWGVVWADLCRLDYGKTQVREIMAKVFLFWCRRGVDGFRCDAGYMVPESAWNYIVARVRSEYPDTVFMLEGLGGPVAVQEKLLASSGLDWAYSELFQNYSRDQISSYYPYMVHAAETFGSMVSFAETHDNLRLAATSRRYAKMRFLVCGLLAADGAFGFANGAEFFATEKIDVHGCGALNFNEKDNLVALIRKINDCHRFFSPFFPGAKLKLVQQGAGNVVALLRTGSDGEKCLVLINLDCERDGIVSFEAGDLPDHGIDLLAGCAVKFRREGALYRFPLAAGAGVCVAFREVDFSGAGTTEPAVALHQRAAAMAQRAAYRLKGYAACGGVSGEKLLESPVGFVENLAGYRPAPVTIWNAGVHDERRQVLLPSQDALLVRAGSVFRCEIRLDVHHTLALAESLPSEEGGEFVLFALPENRGKYVRVLQIEMTLFPDRNKSRRICGEIWQLPRENDGNFNFLCDAKRAEKCHFFAAGKNGSYTLCRADWSAPYSKYDALLAVNWEKRFPCDRKVLFNSFRAWLVVNDFSQEVSARNLVSFVAGAGRTGRWEFLVPAGQGRRTHFVVTMTHSAEAPGVRITFARPRREGDSLLDDGVRVRLIVRPDVEDRVNHEVTKAYAGAEHAFPGAVKTRANGFSFHGVDFTFSDGSYRAAPEWHYMGHLKLEERYGQEALSDRFSPGYFQTEIAGGEETTLEVALSGTHPVFTPGKLPVSPSIREVGKTTLDAYIVRRDDLFTVIAGYPWFLDWGRDTLIVLRGLVSCGFAGESKKIISAFARFERNGTIPNMIRGNDDANRDTSDAPLYLVVATRDYVAATGDEAFLEEDCGSGRTIREVLLSIIGNYRKGTPNGIVMDAASKLVFSPVHFTWMDTNYPACTPREGYPIEIQSLWYAALKFLGFDDLAAEVSASIEKYYFCGGRDFASDCLHAKRGVPASKAVADDHLRCNQLLALTLDAVKRKDLREKILFSSAELVVPGAIRTLADRDVKYELPIDFHGKRLNDARHPYRGRYEGDEDHFRKVAYHNGTAWCWPFPAYCEALYLEGGEKARGRALALLLTARKYFETGVLGQAPEVVDGDAPHRSGGCIAQAWSVSEFFRVYEILAQN